MKIMLSQPMRDKTYEQIKLEREPLVNLFTIMGYEVVDTVLDISNPPDVKNVSVYYLAKSLELMADIDILFMMSGWENARGCLIEKQTAEAYNIKILYENEEEMNYGK